jgi:hypothetical protein
MTSRIPDRDFLNLQACKLFGYSYPGWPIAAARSNDDKRPITSREGTSVVSSLFCRRGAMDSYGAVRTRVGGAGFVPPTRIARGLGGTGRFRGGPGQIIELGAVERNAD